MNLYEIRLSENISDIENFLDAFFFDCQCALFLVDMTNPKSFKPVEKILTNIKKNNNNYSNLKKIIVENKIDDKYDANNKTIRNFENFFNNIDSLKISIKTGENFEDLLNEINAAINPDSYESNKNLPINQITKRTFKPNFNTNGSISLILVGDSEVGKSNFMTRYTKNEFSLNYIATLGEVK